MGGVGFSLLSSDPFPHAPHRSRPFRKIRCDNGASLGIVMPSFFRYVVDRRIDRFAQFGKRIFNLTGTDTVCRQDCLRQALRRAILPTLQGTWNV